MTFSPIDNIGKTPLVEIKRMNPVGGVKIFAKLEYMNPGGSIKDRPALSMIQDAEKKGLLTSKKTVIEPTSGNTGIGLAMVCAVKGYKLALAMAENASEERKAILKARGAKLILTPSHLGSDGAIEEAYRLAREYPEQYLLMDQYNNPANWQAHYQGTGPEIYSQIRKYTDSEITSIVASIGTSGTIMGLSRFFKEKDPSINIVCAHPYQGHKIQGLKNMKESYVPGIFNKKRLDRITNVEDSPAFAAARDLALKEGLFVGMSSGAAMVAAIEEAKEIKEGIIVVIFPDSGERYLSTPLFSRKKAINLNLHDTLTKKKQTLAPINDDKVCIYTCGPTVNKRLHIAQYRRFVFTDILIKLIEFSGLRVEHIVNITDYDDKTIQGAEKSGISISEFTKPKIKEFLKDLKRLGVRPAQAYPKVSEHIDDMTELVGQLIAKNHAYEKLHSVYFDISSLEEYGALSGTNLNKIKVGVTVDLDDYEKNNPRDFTLLKRVGLAELRKGIGIKTQWGNVRPSLHLQCAAISTRHLGASFDIHTGSEELVFPHHENEIAIAKAAFGTNSARIWLHCAASSHDGSLCTKCQEEKFQEHPQLYIDDLVFQGWNEKEIRFCLLSSHYRKQLTLSKTTLTQTRQTLGKINRCIKTLISLAGSQPPEALAKADQQIEQMTYNMKKDILNALSEDLNVSKMLACLLAHVRSINQHINRKNPDSSSAWKLIDAFKEINKILGVMDIPENRPFSREATKIIAQRKKARQNRDFVKADLLRETLIKMGVPVHDKKNQ